MLIFAGWKPCVRVAVFGSCANWRSVSDQEPQDEVECCSVPTRTTRHDEVGLQFRSRPDQTKTCSGKHPPEKSTNSLIAF